MLNELKSQDITMDLLSFTIQRFLSTIIRHQVKQKLKKMIVAP